MIDIWGGWDSFQMAEVYCTVEGHLGMTLETWNFAQNCNDIPILSTNDPSIVLIKQDSLIPCSSQFC